MKRIPHHYGGHGWDCGFRMGNHYDWRYAAGVIAILEPVSIHPTETYDLEFP